MESVRVSGLPGSGSRQKEIWRRPALCELASLVRLKMVTEVWHYSSVEIFRGLVSPLVPRVIVGNQWLWILIWKTT